MPQSEDEEVAVDAVGATAANSCEESVGKGDEESFAFAISFGSLCVTASWLQKQGLRTGSGPFDWIHSSPALVRHCLRDDFSTFLDRSLYFIAGQSVGHKVYSKMLVGMGSERKPLWLHHDPLAKEEHHALVGRSAERLRQVLYGAGAKHRKLFVMCILVKSSTALKAVRLGKMKSSKRQAKGSKSARIVQDDEGNGWALASHAEVRGLYQDLCSRDVQHFHLEVVYLCVGAASKMRNGSEPLVDVSFQDSSTSSTLIVHELHLVGGHTGLRFKDTRDESALTELLRRTRAVETPRSFGLISQQASGNWNDNVSRVASKYGDDLEPGRKFVASAYKLMRRASKKVVTEKLTTKRQSVDDSQKVRRESMKPGSLKAAFKKGSEASAPSSKSIAKCAKKSPSRVKPKKSPREMLMRSLAKITFKRRRLTKKTTDPNVLAESSSVIPADVTVVSSVTAEISDPAESSKSRAHEAEVAVGIHRDEADCDKALSDLDGQWTDIRGNVIEIKDLHVKWLDGTIAALTNIFDDTFDYKLTLDGEECYAEHQSGTLLWNDDDIWQLQARAVQEKQESKEELLIIDLVAMGFSRDATEVALSQSGGDQSEAIELLLVTA